MDVQWTATTVVKARITEIRELTRNASVLASLQRTKQIHADRGQIIPLALNAHVNGTFHVQTTESGIRFCILVVFAEITLRN